MEGAVACLDSGVGADDAKSSIVLVAVVVLVEGVAVADCSDVW